MTVELKDQIHKLVELQKVDAEIYQLKKELSTHPALKHQIEADFEKKKAGVKAAEDGLRAFQLKQKEKEVELQSREDKITKYKSQLYTLKSNKEYSAMELEIKGAQADKSLLEEDVLKLLDSVDEAKIMVAKEKEALAIEDRKMKQELDVLKKREDELNAAVAAHEEQRKVFVPNVEARLLGSYERILKGRDGVALVPVKNGSCGGCHLELPAQVVNEIQIQDKLVVCESCARILYWPTS